MANQELLDIALRQYGVKEFPGHMHNPIIMAYSDEVGFKGIIKDETAWCSIFMNWCAHRVGLERSGKLDARSWLKVGTPVERPNPGDVVVFWREDKDSWKGHVGIFISYSEDHKRIYCLGGNQNNMVCIKPYPAERVLGFRKLGNAPVVCDMPNKQPKYVPQLDNAA